MLKQKDNSNKIIIILLVLIMIFSIILFIKIKSTEIFDNKEQIEISKVLNTIDVNNITDDGKTTDVTDRMLKVKELQKVNTEVVGWLEVIGTDINYPVCQGKDNDYYLKHTYKKENNMCGSLFLDKDYDFNKPSENLLIYGHRNKKGLMFDELVKYKDKEFYNGHKIIRLTTAKDDSKYEILAAFKSRVYYQDETNVFRYYQFVNAKNQNEYDEFVSNAKKESLYDTGINANYGEQLLTLSTCDYEVKDGRFAVVAKKISKN